MHLTIYSFATLDSKPWATPEECAYRLPKEGVGVSIGACSGRQGNERPSLLTLPVALSHVPAPGATTPSTPSRPSASVTTLLSVGPLAPRFGLIRFERQRRLEKYTVRTPHRPPPNFFACLTAGAEHDPLALRLSQAQHVCDQPVGLVSALMTLRIRARKDSLGEISPTEADSP